MRGRSGSVCSVLSRAQPHEVNNTKPKKVIYFFVRMMYWHEIFDIQYVALLLLIISITVLSIIHYTSFFQPAQWLTPIRKVILITGCDSGIGLRLAQHFHSRGSIVIATVLCVDSARVAELRYKLRGDRFHLLQLDITDQSSKTRLVKDVENILAQYQLGLHALINNAGVCVYGEFDFYTDAQIENQILVNFAGTISLTHRLLPLLIRSEGRIVNVSSVNAIQSFPGVSVYCGTKRGIEGFADSLRMELHRFGVQVINVRLGDYARLTNIMADHERVIHEQELELSEFKRYIYGNYFYRFHRIASKNFGYFSPESFERSSLFDDFDKAIYAVISPTHFISATLRYKLIITFFALIPRRLAEYVLRKVTATAIAEQAKRENRMGQTKVKQRLT